MKVFLFLFFISSIISFRPNPSFALTNFKDMIMGWCSCANSMEVDPIRPSGVCSLRWSENTYANSAIENDGFSFIIGDKKYTNPFYFIGTNTIESNGEYTHKLKEYNKVNIDKVTIQKNFLVVPETNILLEEYYFTNNDSNEINVNVLDFISTPNASVNISAGLLSDSKTFYIDYSSAEEYKNMIMIVGMIDPNTLTVKNNYQSITSLFETEGKLDDINTLSDKKISIGYQKEITLSPSQTVSLLVYRGLAKDKESAESLQKEILSKTYEEFKEISNQYLQNKLSTFKTPEFSTEDEKKMWYSSVLTLLYSQNPTLGTLVASFHPQYENKVWTRDASYASIILTALGDYSDSKKYLLWLSKAEKRELGNLATCYDWFSGEIVGFVEPQYDSVGASLAAYYYYYSLSKDDSIFKEESVINTIKTFEDFLLFRDYKNLTRPDYSIWEESSDGWSGKPLPVQYFAFTQIQSHFGLRCAMKMEEKIFKNQQRADELKLRADDLSIAFNENFWNKDEEYFVQSIWSDTKLKKNIIDSSSSTLLFTDIVTDKKRIKKQLNKIRKDLTKLDYGISRYFYDPYFFESKFNPSGKEVGEASPPWGVVTMFLAWGELLADSFDHHAYIVKNRLKWMMDHTGPEFIPCGEAIDSITGEPVSASMPDVYEHAGVYIMTVLQSQGKVPLFNYNKWE